ncbi:MAG: hypothetical protein QM271_01825 [Bacillota bacterium]|jgi:hypothetical protein|nr:hypothetical protein [Bacillota bacterium]
MENKNITVIEKNPGTGASIENQLTVMGERMVQDAKQMEITCQTDYENAGASLIKIKDQAKKIKDYWAEPKRKAKAAHQEIVDREKAMLSVLNEAEAIIKGTMRHYIDAVEKARREAEAEARRRQEEEAARLLEMAVQAEQSGDDHGAAVSMAMAEMVSEMPAAPVIEAPKASGISTRKTWKARVTDPAKVPCYANGVEIRPVNMSALNNLARMTKGTAEIPGVEFFEESSIAARI